MRCWAGVVQKVIQELLLTHRATKVVTLKFYEAQGEYCEPMGEWAKQIVEKTKSKQVYHPVQKHTCFFRLFSTRNK